jgi:hypothetical protein
MSAKLSIFAASLMLAFRITSPAIERTIDEQTARHLVEGALQALSEDPKRVSIDIWRYYSAPEFYNFSAARAGSQGVLIVHYLSVNSWTGDVWDAMACKRLITPQLKGEQDVIWQQSGIPAEARAEFSNRSPGGCASKNSSGRVDKKH